jgi:hypothetical protein
VESWECPLHVGNSLRYHDLAAVHYFFFCGGIVLYMIYMFMTLMLFLFLTHNRNQTHYIGDHVEHTVLLFLTYLLTSLVAITIELFNNKIHISFIPPNLSIFVKLKLNSLAVVRMRTIPTKGPTLVGEVSANLCG